MDWSTLFAWWLTHGHVHLLVLLGFHVEGGAGISPCPNSPGYHDSSNKQAYALCYLLLVHAVCSSSEYNNVDLNEYSISYKPSGDQNLPEATSVNFWGSITLDSQ